MGQNRANREQGRWKGQDLLKVWGEGVRSLQDGPGQLQKDWGGLHVMGTISDASGW